MIKADIETKIECSTCGKMGILREVVVAHNGMARKISYETHHESVLDPEHSDALNRTDEFYRKVLDLVVEFNNLSDATKIVRVEGAAGILGDFDIGSQRPSACEVRTTIIPIFTLRTFKKNHEIQLTPRNIDSANFQEILDEVIKRSKPIIEDARDNNLLGLE